MIILLYRYTLYLMYLLPTYLVKPQSIEFINHKQILSEYDKFDYSAIEISRSNLSLLNQIEYLLSIPIKDLALHLNEDSDLDKLVYWRYSCPLDTLIS